MTLYLRFRTWGINTAGSAVRAYLNLREHRRAISARENPTQIDQYVWRALQPGSVAIVATYPRGPVEDGFIAFLKCLAERNVQILVVSTASLSPEFKRSLEPFASVAMQIANIGRDFGAYQRGVAYVRDTVGLDNVARLTFVNDSNYFFERADYKPLVTALLDPVQDYVGSNETFEFHYHVGSFLFSISGAVVQSTKFQAFWSKYVPYSTRPHSINAGEVGLSKAIMAAGFAPNVVYTVYGAMPFLEQRLKKPLADFSTWCIALRQGIFRAYGEGSMPQVLMADEVSSFIHDRNQSHVLGLIFVKYLGAPFIKKDVIWNGVHLLNDLVRVAKETEIGDPDLLARSFRQRGVPSSRRFMLVTKIKSAFRLI